MAILQFQTILISFKFNLFLIGKAPAKTRTISTCEIRTYHSVRPQEMWILYTSIFPNSSAWEQQELNKAKKQKKVRRKEHGRHE